MSWLKIKEIMESLLCVGGGMGAATLIKNANSNL